MRNVLYVLSASWACFAVLRLVSDGPRGELVTATALLASSVMFVGGAVIGEMARMRHPPG